MRVYLLVLLIAAAVTYLLTPLAYWIAARTGAITAVRDRDVHTIPTARLGGLAMTAGLVVAVAFASQMPFLEGVFEIDHRAWAIVGGALIVCLLGVADDIWDLDWMTKLAGQVLAALFIAWQGVQLTTFPINGLVIGSSRLSLIVTVLVVVVAMNAVNFVDGLDGLAAGLIAIGGSAYFVYTYSLTVAASPTDYSNLATLVMAALVGICLGFLPHNFHPARIFMGDSGSMVLGLVLASAVIVVTGSIDMGTASDPSKQRELIPILLPLAVILLPLLDMVLAVARRVGTGKSPFHPDRLHLHHRLLALGHSHRRAVIIMYLWTAVFAFGAVALVRWPAENVAIGLGVAVVVAAILTLGPLRTRGRFLDDDAVTAPEGIPTAVPRRAAGASGASPVVPAPTPGPPTGPTDPHRAHPEGTSR
ncbi:undecaprenyl/decaprenyl-phosphate alpha-N-acetylglucosaminyl 1-phosphate transferase [Oerskovia sp. Sa1BUA8]|uniref:Undecaprenyl/decaprenyl-phosphate alpha-N-acetylglucosaminyl 1-phosphate transferase n=1 Tax=Oerskovia douganii TaxID=2762210 RepID=A0A9D5UB03_9CELL|nr:MraY family glycosyltransferase [Oerskovia douganii]MBE7700756.1 undecaprenyl/decaprenyl-phosphate alpha-N-acetylglucosaminyl 1-phosphate transferase [Oerskovia douganii]